jgi:multidrug efflux system membrane fusion protein
VDAQGRRGVYMVQKGQAVFRAVSIGLEEPDRIEITDGLEEGEEVVTTGASALRDGTHVLLAGPSASRPGSGGTRPTGEGVPKAGTQAQAR